MKKRLISLLLSVAVLTTSVPVSTFADPSAGQEPAVSSEKSQERELTIRKTGELFRRTIRLLRNIRLLSCRERKTSENRGYEFGGWYDNPELIGKQLPVWIREIMRVM